MVRKWIESILQGILASIIFAIIPGGFVVYLAHVKSEWAIPILMGLGATAMCSVSLIGISGFRRLPPKKEVTTVETVERQIRAWLNNFRYAVQNDPNPFAFFWLIITTSAGVRMSVGRLKEDMFRDYIVVRTDITATPEEAAFLAGLSSQELGRILLELKIELARARVGSSPIQLPSVGTFSIFKRVPINDSLTEHVLVGMIDDLEAAFSAAGSVVILGMQRNNWPVLPAPAKQIT